MLGEVKLVCYLFTNVVAEVCQNFATVQRSKKIYYKIILLTLHGVCLFVLDIDECSESLPKCDDDQRCENYPGTYRCFCNSPRTSIVNGMCKGRNQ